MRTRVFRRTPVVYVGRDAAALFACGRGVLLGAHRPATVEVTGLVPVEGRNGRRLIEARLDWEGAPAAVGVLLSSDEFQRFQGDWTRDLVPGDVVIVRRSSEAVSARLHRGDRLVRARLSLPSGPT